MTNLIYKYIQLIISFSATSNNYPIRLRFMYIYSKKLICQMPFLTATIYPSLLMINELELGIKTLEFASKIIGLDHDIVVNTNIYRKNLCQYDLDDDPDFDTSHDLYTIKADPKITVMDVLKLFIYMQIQFKSLADFNEPLYYYIADIKFNKNLNRYFIKLVTDDDTAYFFGLGANIPVEFLKFTHHVIGLKRYVVFDSGIYKRIDKSVREKLNLKTRFDMYDLFYDKKYNIADVIDMFSDINQQYLSVYKCADSGSYFVSIRSDSVLSNSWYIRWES